MENVNRDVRAEIVSVESKEEASQGFHYHFEAVTSDGERFSVATDQSFVDGVGFRLKEGDEVQLSVIGEGEEQTVYFVDVNRLDGLSMSALLLGILILVVAKRRGLGAMAGLASTVVILAGVVLPALQTGHNPVLVSLLAAAGMLGITMVLSHGIRKNTLLAYVATLMSLLCVLVMSVVFTHLSQISGLSSETAQFLVWENEVKLSAKGLLLASVILSAAGVLDDIAITQVETVAVLKAQQPSSSRRDLFQKAMHIGSHHIASAVNTLTLAYVGASLPLFLLFYATTEGSLPTFVNTELIAEEIVRTLAGTFGLVLAVPFATWLGLFGRESEGGHHHS